MSAREEILARIGRAVAGAADIEIPRHYLQERPAENIVELFAERVDDYRAIVHVVPAAELAGKIDECLGERRVIVPDGFDRAGGWDDLKTADGVVTTCAVGIAETGTIVLDHGPGQGTRAQTLVPDYHLCVVRADQIVAGVPEALARLDPARPLTWISGPSATSDIELNRVEGVHGPRTLEVIIST
ncbi:L-lactate dehydrogenase complex protein LldG [Nonomuraea solani]|uniref:L-lactate dehydrogenase complex protein LldG n=1 Tax=Nonomuraea solani TaxID=1144553 RepID=A0A1H6DQQ1_9ACTN|nr:LUD domain-containing protein [Nonomuraea solani]SEG87571.1 L-lactate dehydrogenase complex protein LldG [Nonomuraea solani]